MKKTTTILFAALTVLLLTTSPKVFAQTLFSDDFESGMASTDWGSFWEGEEVVTAVPMATAPDPLPDGGDYIGYLQDIDGSYYGAAVNISGPTTSSNYSIEGDVYCYVNHPDGSAYTGLVVYADPANNDYYKLRVDFDVNDRINFSGYKSDSVTYLPLYSHDFLGSENPGLFPTTDGWHTMKIEVKTLNADSTAFWCYFDDQLLYGCPIYDTISTRNMSGSYGLYSFQVGDGIEGYFDNIVVTSMATAIDNHSSIVPENFSLEQNYPNPFNPETQISYRLVSGGSTTLGIYDLLGREIKVLVNKDQASGSYTVKWDGTDTFGNKVPSGIYLYRLKTGDFTASKKMVLLK